MTNLLKQPDSSDEFIRWLFKGRCIMCNHSATEINEIIPRSRSKNSLLDWKNRVMICRSCHTEFHSDGVTLNKIVNMQQKRKEFLKSIGREDYI